MGNAVDVFTVVKIDIHGRKMFAHIDKTHNSVYWYVDTKSYLDYYMRQNGESTADIVHAEFIPTWYEDFDTNSQYNRYWIGSWDTLMAHNVCLYEEKIIIEDGRLDQYVGRLVGEMGYYIQKRTILSLYRVASITVWTNNFEYETYKERWMNAGHVRHRRLRNGATAYPSLAGYVSWKDTVPESYTNAHVHD